VPKKIGFFTSFRVSRLGTLPLASPSLTLSTAPAPAPHSLWTLSLSLPLTPSDLSLSLPHCPWHPCPVAPGPLLGSLPLSGLCSALHL